MDEQSPPPPARDLGPVPRPTSEASAEERPRVAVVDDDPAMRRVLSLMLADAGFRAVEFDGGAGALAGIDGTMAVVCLDLGLDDLPGIEVLRRLRAGQPDVPVIVVTARTRVEEVVEAMKAGAHDYLAKPIEALRFRQTVRMAAEHRAMVAKLRRLEGALDERDLLETLAGQGPAMREVARAVVRVRRADVNVAIMGESGTGKELVARAIHDGGETQNGPFVAVNCASIPAAIQESELFGHEKGAFTGATGTHHGKFEQASGGTLFLDEIGEMAPATQASLLRVLQERVIVRIGGRAEIPVNARVICATHRDLAAEVRAGRFREDLYFRLVVYPIRLPPLRHRADDLPVLVAELLRRSRIARARGVDAVSPEALAVLADYRWPGNVRELDNVIQRACLACDGSQLGVQHLPPENPRARRGDVGPDAVGGDAGGRSAQGPLRPAGRTAPGPRGPHAPRDREHRRPGRARRLRGQHHRGRADARRQPHQALSRHEADALSASWIRWGLRPQTPGGCVREGDLDTDNRFTGKLGLWEKDLHTGVLQWDGAIDEILGVPGLAGGRKPSLDSLLDAIVPEERAGVAEALQSSHEDRLDRFQADSRCRRHDGRELVIRNEWNVERDADGRPAVLRGVVQDVTHRRRDKAALRRKTALIELLYEVAACANDVETLDEALRTSLEHIRAFGGWSFGSAYLVSPGEPRGLVPSPVWCSSHPARFHALRAATLLARDGLARGLLGSVVRTGEPAWSPELQHRLPAVTASAAIAAGMRAVLAVPVRVGAETAAVLELFADHKVPPDVEVMQAMRNVAALLGRVFERMRADEALRESEARLRQILESMPIGVFVMDAAGDTYFANKYARTIAGQGGGSGAIDVHRDVFVAGTDQRYPVEKNPLFRALAKESSVVADMELRAPPHGGDPLTPARRIPLEVWGSPVFDERGRVAYALTAFHDITERRKVERMKDEFVSVVSHELRTPLTSIQGALGLLENGVLGNLGGEALEMAQIAGDGSRRLLRLVNELLDIQKLELGTPTGNPEPVALGPLLSRAVAASRPYAATLRIGLDLDDRAPAVVVLADPDRLSQVIANLLSNAIKFTPPGEGVAISAARVAGNRVRVAVEDRGPGVPDEFRSSLFRKFSQADASDARQKGGTGLGLAICKVIVERLGGAIAHEPRAGGGACFYFELPELFGSAG